MASIPSVLSIVALVAGVAVMLVVHVVVILWALRQGVGGGVRTSRAEEEEEDGCGGGGQGLSADELDTLPCHDFIKAGAGDCAVCLEAFDAGDRCRRLPRCEHIFHAPCVDPWLRKSRCCPVCRAAAVVVDRSKGEQMKAAESSMEMAERRSCPATLEILVER